MAITASLSQQVNACDRLLTLSISGGSGNYQIAWGANGGCGTPANYSQSTLSIPNCGSDGTYYAFVLDLNTNQQAFASIFVNKVLTGSFSAYLPNVFTPNGDGINDTFDIFTSSQGSGPINAHTLVITVSNRWGAQIFSQTYTNYGGTGINARFVMWNGSGSGNVSGTYYYGVTLYNCSGNQFYNGPVTIL